VGPSSPPDAALSASPGTLAPAAPAESWGWRAVSAILLRFITCGALGVGGGFAGRHPVAPRHLGVGTSLAGVVSFLIGFMVGGLTWFASDLRRRRRQPERISDERFVFSVVVFAAIPFSVLVLVAAIWGLTLLIA
jgi:formate-dependent nitrite reductase membrane component NrfD